MHGEWHGFAAYQLCFFKEHSPLKQYLGLLKENSDTHFLTAVSFVQVDTINNGLDRCAALLKNILQNEATGCTYWKFKLHFGFL